MDHTLRGSLRSSRSRSRDSHRSRREAGGEDTATDTTNTAATEEQASGEGGIGRAASSRRSQVGTERANQQRLVARALRDRSTRAQVAAEHTRLVTRLGDPVGRVGTDQSSAVSLEEDRADLAAEPSSLGSVASRQTGHEEADLGLLGVSGKTDEGTRNVVLKLGGVLQERLAVAGLGQSEVAARGGEAGHLGAELLDGSRAQVVLLLQAAQVGGVVDAGAAGQAGQDGGRHGGRRVVTLQQTLEVPGELDDLDVRRRRRAGRRSSRRRGGGRLGHGGTSEHEAAQEREETHFWVFCSFLPAGVYIYKREYIQAKV